MNLPYKLLNRYDGVAFQVLPKGKSFWSKLQRYEYLKSMEIGKGFHAPKGSVMCVSGAIGFFRTKRLLSQINQHSGEFSGEDLERTLLIHASLESKGVTYVSLPVLTEVPQSLREWYRQRCLGWNPGFMGNVVLLTKVLFMRKKPLRLKYDAFYNLLNIPLDILRILSLPILIKYPQYLVTMYCIYVALDVLAYIGTNRSVPSYFILLSPLYGIGSMLTRFVGMFVYMYRESIEILFFSMRAVPDSYRRAPLYMQLIGLTLSVSAAGGVLIYALLMI
jgi:cellulose synthase/poly-beta-1,6-N-acetylglucosamine synthase-like glycosyltransferase